MTRIVVLVPLAATVVIASMAEGFAPRATTLGETAAAASSSSSSTTPRRFIRPSTELRFGLPSFLNKNEEEEDEEEDPNLEKPTVGLKGLIQLVTAGAGAPFLGDYQGVDKETGNFMFSLEANNLVDEEGKSKQTSMPYFESGWVDPEDLKKEEENKKKKKGGGFKLW